MDPSASPAPLASPPLPPADAAAAAERALLNRKQAEHEFLNTEMRYIDSLISLREAYAVPLSPRATGPALSNVVLGLISRAGDLGVRAVSSLGAGGLASRIESTRNRIATAASALTHTATDAVGASVTALLPSAVQIDAHLLLTQSEHEQLFAGLDRLLPLHHALLEGLEGAMSGWVGEGRETVEGRLAPPPVAGSTLGQVVAGFAPYLKLYGDVCSRVPLNQRLLDKLVETRPGFARFLADAAAAHPSLQPLAALLVLPVQRVTKYQELLKSLIRYTVVVSPTHADLPALRNALERVLAVVAQVNSNAALFDAQRRMIDVAYRFWPPAAHALVRPARSLVREGILDKMGQRGDVRPATFFLFSDSTFAYGGRSPLTPLMEHLLAWEENHLVSLRGACADGQSARLAADAGYLSGGAFTLYGRERSLIVIARSGAERSAWLKDIEECVARRQQGIDARRSVVVAQGGSAGVEAGSGGGERSVAAAAPLSSGSSGQGAAAAPHSSGDSIQEIASTLLALELGGSNEGEQLGEGRAGEAPVRDEGGPRGSSSSSRAAAPALTTSSSLASGGGAGGGVSSVSASLHRLSGLSAAAASTVVHRLSGLSSAASTASSASAFESSCTGGGEEAAAAARASTGHTRGAGAARALSLPSPALSSGAPSLQASGGAGGRESGGLSSPPPFRVGVRPTSAASGSAFPRPATMAASGGSSFQQRQLLSPTGAPPAPALASGSSASPLRSPPSLFSPAASIRVAPGEEDGEDDTTAPVFLPDSSSDACGVCRAAFTLIHRRHHCRLCGRLVCASCSRGRLVGKRACDVCLPLGGTASP